MNDVQAQPEPIAPTPIVSAVSLRQSRWLVRVAGSLLAVACLAPVPFLPQHPHSSALFLSAGLVSLTFGLGVWALRAATPGAAIFGSIVCQVVVFWSSTPGRSIWHSALSPLAVLFILTFFATRIGKRSRPDLTNEPETRRGRTASQIVANLGFAAFVAFSPAALLAALAEATADTVSSELGQAFGGTPYLLTSFRAVAPGTDGAVSLLGTATGVLAAAAVAASGAWAMNLALRQVLIAFSAAVTGLFFDSLLGATAERRGWLNNDLVNFASTAFAGAVALLLLAF